ncbi:HDOD domain-containing protein [Thermincola potens]|uniref:Metal dependent phosphohydrolase n=1 Tax=Thermincola potens (strain JR) TaxID=635013 RepID=D5X7A2_THEPJ|nr:HDOD domain-containing protein [Thermincola potens]ADG82472.1 metal dependent phosphohydrolase [Thermincola potens JR]
MSPTLEDIIKKSEELPALPKVVHKALALIDDPDSTLESISSLISRDPVLTFRVLKLANSAYYGYSRKIATVQEAVLILGLAAVKNLLLTVSVYKIMNKKVAGYILEKGELWKHSMVSALIARQLAQRFSCCDPEKAFMAALTHDIGKIVMNHYIAPQLKEVIAVSERERIPFQKAEEMILGFNHAQVGGGIARQWNLPEELVEAIQFHHEPLSAQINPKLTAITHVADVTCMSMGVGLGGDGLLYPIEEQALQLLQLAPADIENLIAEVVDSIQENEEMLMVN